jgi:hypothetical protein
MLLAHRPVSTRARKLRRRRRQPRPASLQIKLRIFDRRVRPRGTRLTGLPTHSRCSAKLIEAAERRSSVSRVRGILAVLKRAIASVMRDCGLHAKGVGGAWGV